MNLKVNKEIIRSSQCICSTAQEQAVELDYVLPDYCPEIFRIIKCIPSPRITSCSVNNDKLSYELTVCLKVIYCTEGSSRPQVIDQKLTYNRSVSLERSCSAADVRISAEPDHVSCRAVNRRRIDIRGAVTIHICAMGEIQTEAVCDVFGGNIQLKRNSLSCPAVILKCARRAAISDELELPEGKPPVGNIIRACAENISSDKKLIANKLAAKGELKISILYTASAGFEDENVPCVQTMQFTLPYSQLIEMEGLDERCDCRITPRVISCDVTPKAEMSEDGDPQSKILECEVMMLFECTAVRMAVCDIAADEYSTAYRTSHVCVPVRIPKEPITVDCTYSVKGSCAGSDEPVSVIYDAWCSSSKLRPTISGGKVTVSGNAVLCIMGETAEKEPVICETEVPVEIDVAAEAGLDLSMVSDIADTEFTFPVLSVSYNLTPENTAEVKAEIGVRGRISDYTPMEVITDITAEDEIDVPEGSDCALRLYFAEEGEELWDIAKRYRASVAAVAEENDLDSDRIKESRMLLIPMT